MPSGGFLMHATCRPWIVIAPIVLTAVAAFSGCTWMGSLRGDGFQSWNQSLGGQLRSKAEDSQPSGFFTDSRSDQIERNLGGGF